MSFKLTLSETATFATLPESEHRQAQALRGRIALREVRTDIGQRLQLRRDLLAGLVVFVVVFAGGVTLTLSGLV